MQAASLQREPVGECIYCGCKAGLSEEHVVPFGLGGDYVLPLASCVNCAAKTSREELKVMRGFMGDARLVAKLPTRRKKLRATVKSHEFYDQEMTRKMVLLGIPESIAFLHLPTLAEGSYMSSQPPSKGAKLIGLETVKFGGDMVACMQANQATQFQEQVKIDVHAFTRMLAKIAYGYAVGELGLFPREESPALALAMGLVDNPSNWISSRNLQIPASSAAGLHAMMMLEYRRDDGLVANTVRVALFRNSGASNYEVVVRARDWLDYERIVRPELSLRLHQECRLPAPSAGACWLSLCGRPGTAPAK